MLKIIIVTPNKQMNKNATLRPDGAYFLTQIADELGVTKSHLANLLQSENIIVKNDRYFILSKDYCNIGLAKIKMLASRDGKNQLFFKKELSWTEKGRELINTIYQNNQKNNVGNRC